MSTDDNKILIQSLYEAFGRGDVDHITSTLSPDVVWDVPDPTGTLPWCGTYSGPDEVLGLFGALDTHLETHGMDAEQMIAEGDTVVSFGTERHTVKATGKTFESPWVHIFTVRDGKVVAFREINDNAPGVAAHS